MSITYNHFFAGFDGASVAHYLGVVVGQALGTSSERAA